MLKIKMTILGSLLTFFSVAGFAVNDITVINASKDQKPILIKPGLVESATIQAGKARDFGSIDSDTFGIYSQPSTPTSSNYQVSDGVEFTERGIALSRGTDWQTQSYSKSSYELVVAYSGLPESYGCQVDLNFNSDKIISHVVSGKCIVEPNPDGNSIEFDFLSDPSIANVQVIYNGTGLAPCEASVPNMLNHKKH